MTTQELKKRLRRMRITQKDIAQAIGYNRSTVNGFLNSREDLAPARMREICVAAHIIAISRVNELVMGL